MENQENLITPLFEKIQEYGNTSYELVKLRTVEKTVGFLSRVASGMVILLVVCMVLLFSGVALAIWLGQLAGEMYVGFAWVALIYVFLGGMTLLFFRKWMRRKFADFMVSSIFN